MKCILILMHLAAKPAESRAAKVRSRNTLFKKLSARKAGNAVVAHDMEGSALEQVKGADCFVQCIVVAFLAGASARKGVLSKVYHVPELYRERDLHMVPG
jgi:hypothetical protein